MKLLLLAFVFTSSAAFASDTTCIYRAPSSEGGLNQVVINFNQDYTGYPMGATIDVIRPSGRVNRVSIPGQDLFNARVEGSAAAELLVEMHVRTPNAVLDLRYLGNEFRSDTADFLRLDRRPTVPEMFIAYVRMGEFGGIRHRMAPGVNPVVEFSATVNWNGRPSRLSSTQFVCSYSSEN